MSLRPIHAFDFNGTLVTKEFGPEWEAHVNKEVFEPLFSTVLELSNEAWKERFPEAAEKGLTREVVHDRLLDIVGHPPKFTKARAAYYLILEGEIRAGKLDAGLAPDVLEKDSALLRARDRGDATALLSRGTESLLEATLDGIHMRGSFDLVESTIPHGNLKTKEMYLSFAASLRERGYRLAYYYDDEPQFVYQAYLAAQALKAEGEELFKIFWINRDGLPETALTDLLPEEEREEVRTGVKVRPDLRFDPL